MPELELYGEKVHNFPLWTKLKTLFSMLTYREKCFVNLIRSLYYQALFCSAKPRFYETGSHVFFGGHVLMIDSGLHYKLWTQQLFMMQLRGGARLSSHYKDIKYTQYEIVIPGLGCVLFGKNELGNTWFQNEGWPATDGPAKALAHIVLGFAAHKLSGNMQVGSLGMSTWTEKEKKELIIDASYFASSQK